MNDKELLYIKTIAEEGNLSRAARKLHVAQPSLTQCVQRLEKDLECPLFIRKRSGLELTGYGELYYDAACRILSVWKDFSQEIQLRKQQENGHLTIGASWYNTLLILTKVLPDFSQAYPAVEVSLAEKNTAGLLPLLENGEADLILIHQYPKEFPGGDIACGKKLRIRPLLREAFCLVAHERFHLEAVSDLKEIEKLPFLRFTDGQRIRQISDFVLEQAGISPPAALTTYGFPSAIRLAGQGMGVTFLPETYAREEAKQYPQLRVLPIDSRFSAYWTASACYAPGRLSLPAQRFLRILSRAFPPPAGL